MAEINIPEGNARHRNRAKKVNVKVDLTPMVDLAFLLITFFMLTTSLKKQMAIDLTAPIDSGPTMPVAECQVLNLLADSLGQLYYWEGLECTAVKPIALSGAQGLSNKIKAKKEDIKHQCLKSTGKPREIICLIKLLPHSRYSEMIGILDEMSASKVGSYAIKDYSEEEIKAVGVEQHKMAMK